MEDDLKEIRRLIPLAKVKTKGSADPLWDAIFDGEALLAGRPTLGNADAPLVRRWLEEGATR